MPVDPKINVLVKPVNQQVFEFVAKQRQVHLKDLWDYLSEITNKQKITESLDELERAGLIKAETAPIEDFYTYYVTSDGLQAERQFRRLRAMA